MIYDNEKYQQVIYDLVELFYDLKKSKDDYVKDLLLEVNSKGIIMARGNLFLGLLTCIGFGVYPSLAVDRGSLTMSAPQNEDDMVACPYNKSHMMLRKSLAKHLVKCRPNYLNVELQKCPFNNTHLVTDAEFINHVNICPDRKLITQYNCVPKLEDHPQHKPIETDENWDNTEVEDYDPKKYLENARVLRQPEGACPSARNEFIKKERQRLGYDDDGPNYSRESCKQEETDQGKSTPPPPPPPIISDWPAFSRSETTSTNLKTPPTLSREYSPSPGEKSYRDRSPLPGRSRRKARTPRNRSKIPYKRDKDKDGIGICTRT
ncbi:hypothetical protein GQX74_014485 [Glossina fuscipes]|nr:hypothetical protein GQX74_014485 [Glossina fuscipes]